MKFGRQIKSVLIPLLKPLSRFGTVLMYHSVVEQRPNGDEFAPNRALCVAEGDFAAHMEYLSRNYRCASVAELARDLQRGELTPGTVVVSFDDGYRDNYLRALPILQRFRVPAVIFVSTGLINRSADFWWHEVEFITARCSSLTVSVPAPRTLACATVAEKYHSFYALNCVLMRCPAAEQQVLMAELRAQCPERYCYNEAIMSWDEVRECAAHPLITIGSHTVMHYVLRQLPDDVLRHEFVQSKLELEQRLSQPIESIGYPYGGTDQVLEREFKAAAAAGYQIGFTTRSGHLSRALCATPLAVPRVAVDGRDTVQNLRWKLAGGDFLMSRIRGLRTSNA